MFRNVLNGYVRKAFDYLKIDDNENGGNGSSSNNQETTQQPITRTTRSISSTSLTTQRDHNNNNLVEHIRKQHRQKQEGLNHQPAAAAIIGTNSSLRPQPQTEQNQHHSHPHHKKYSQYSLIDEFDWFKPFKESPLSVGTGENQPREEEEDEDEDESLFDASITSSSLSVTGYHRGGRLHHHHRHFDIKFESYYDYLTKFYSASNMANQTRTLDEYLARLVATLYKQLFI